MRHYFYNVSGVPKSKSFFCFFQTRWHFFGFVSEIHEWETAIEISVSVFLSLFSVSCSPFSVLRYMSVLECLCTSKLPIVSSGILYTGLFGWRRVRAVIDFSFFFDLDTVFGLWKVNLNVNLNAHVCHAYGQFDIKFCIQVYLGGRYFLRESVFRFFFSSLETLKKKHL